MSVLQLLCQLATPDPEFRPDAAQVLSSEFLAGTCSDASRRALPLPTGGQAAAPTKKPTSEQRRMLSDIGNLPAASSAPSSRGRRCDIAVASLV